MKEADAPADVAPGRSSCKCTLVDMRGQTVTPAARIYTIGLLKDLSASEVAIIVNPTSSRKDTGHPLRAVRHFERLPAPEAP